MSTVIIGSYGRMGKSIIKILKEQKKTFIEVNRDNSLEKVEVSQAEVVIDFSSVGFFNEALNWSVDHSLPFVSGTTGLSKDQFSALNNASAKIPVLWAPNMSIGIAFMNKMLKSFGELSRDYDFQIEELHHNKKIDKPSGTGILLQNTLSKAVDKEIPNVLSIRGGGIYGVHKVWAMSEGEVITFEHQAINRDVFARGAVKCAGWLVNQPKGIYKVEDLLNK